MNTQEHKTRKRRFWSFSLTLVFLLCSVMPMTALAAEYYVNNKEGQTGFSTNDVLQVGDTIKANGGENSVSTTIMYTNLSKNGTNLKTASLGSGGTMTLLPYSGAGEGSAFPNATDGTNFVGWKITSIENKTGEDAKDKTYKMTVQAIAKPKVTLSATRTNVGSATVEIKSDKAFTAYQYIISDNKPDTNAWNDVTSTSVGDNAVKTHTVSVTPPQNSSWEKTTTPKVWIRVKDKDEFKSEAENTSTDSVSTLDAGGSNETVPLTGQEIWSDPVAITIDEFKDITVDPKILNFSTTAGIPTSQTVTVTNHTNQKLYLTASYKEEDNQTSNNDVYTFTWSNYLSNDTAVGIVNGKSENGNGNTTTLTIQPKDVFTTGTRKGTISIQYTSTAPSSDGGTGDSADSSGGGGVVTQSLSLLNLNSGISTLDDSEGGNADTTISGSTSINVTFIVNPAGGGGGGGGGSSVTKYTLTYDTNGGEDMKATRHEKNTTVNLSKKIPTRDGYTFVGWFADEALTEPITSVKMTKNTTVYAAWSGGDNPLNPDDPNGNGGGNGVPGALNGKDHIAYMNGYEDGTIKPNQNITRAEAATLFFRMLNEDVRTANYSTVSPFTDVNEGDWFNIAVATMAKMGILKGRTADTYAPNEPITRAEFATICARFDTSNPDTGEVGFTDLTGHWAEADVLRAAALGWVEGYEDGTFRPDAFITRAEVITMMNRLLCRLPETVEDLLEGMKTWPDVAETDWFYLAIQEATNGHTYLYKDQDNHERWLELTDDTIPGENI